VKPERPDNTPIYFDNAATSWPKPECVREALGAYFGEAGGNAGRSGHRMSIAAARVVENARDVVAELLGAQDPSRIVFAHNATEALNTALYGMLHAGDRVVTTGMEHNSVMRPLRHLESRGVRVTVAGCDPGGLPGSDEIRQTLHEGARLLVTTHASNVTGAVLPIAELAAIAREAGVPYLVDAAQTAGAMPIHVERMGVDLLAFTGHKGLLGPTGTGGLYIREGLKVEPLMRGGTGSDSAHEVQPEYAPDAYESGTLNVAGLAGMAAGVRFLSGIGIEAVREHERGLVDRFTTGAEEITGIEVYGPSDNRLRCGVVSFNVAGAVPSEVGLILDQSFGILCRTGLHCAPAAHRSIGTFPAGTVRFSFGWFNTLAEVDASLAALRKIAAWAATGQMETAGGRVWTA